MAADWYVFLDTSAYVASNFSFRSNEFQELIGLCNSGEVKIITTDITVNEVKKKIHDGVNSAKTILKRMRSEARILYRVGNNNFAPIFAPFDSKHIEAELVNNFNSFLQKVSSLFLEASCIPGKKVFELYFEQQPPFGPDGKKDEFPDAFVLEKLNEWAQATNSHICIVSTDADFEKYSRDKPVFQYFKSLGSFIEVALASHTPSVDVVHELIDNNRDDIEKAIGTFAEGLWVLLDDVDGDAHIDEVLQVKMSDENVISVSTNRAIVQGIARVKLRIHLDYNDPDSYYRDDDDGTINYLRKIEKVAERDFTLNVEIEIHYNSDDLEDIDVTRITVNRDEPIFTYAEMNPNDYYK
jgi:hypothetical protein